MKLLRITMVLLLVGFLCFQCGNSGGEGQTTVNEDKDVTSIIPDDSNIGEVNREIAVSRSSAITRAVEKVSPTVVGISTKGTVYREDPWFAWLRYKQDVSGLGSGFVISPNGYIITNHHVVEKAEEITVTLTTKDKYRAELINWDFASDIALLKIDAKDLPYLRLGNSDEILIGEWVIAFGNPYGLFEINDQPSVTVGVVSATGRDFGQQNNNRYYDDMIQTDASINPGNSGGPLVNSLGEVIGLNSFIVTSGGSREGSIGLGFAIPINKVREVINELKATADDDQSYYTGIEIYKYNITRMVQLQLGLRAKEGALIVEVNENSPASKAGLRIRDVIMEVNSVRISRPDELFDYLKRLNPRVGQTLKIVVARGSRLYETNLTLERKRKNN